MKPVYSTDIKIISNVLQQMPLMKVNNQLLHLATVQCQGKTYMAYYSTRANAVWVEEYNHVTNCLEQIADTALWTDLVAYLIEHKLLEIGNRQPVPVAEELANFLGLTKKHKH